MILRRTIGIYGFLFFLRGLSVISTNLPNPNIAHCISTVDDSKPFTEAFAVLATSKLTCYDLLFSGHTVNLTICSLLWTQYATRHRLFNIISISICWCVSFTGYFLIIATHFHYTVDVLIGALLSISLWISYHNYLRFYLTMDTYMSHFIRWFEEPVNTLSSCKPMTKDKDPREVVVLPLRPSQGSDLHDGSNRVNGELNIETMEEGRRVATVEVAVLPDTCQHTRQP